MPENEVTPSSPQSEPAHSEAHEPASSAEETEGTTTGMERRYSTCAGLILGQEQETPTTLVTFRKGRIQVSDATEFAHGKVCGQAACVDNGNPAKEKELFRLFADGCRDIELSESWLVGFFLGLVDALLSGRQSFPPEMQRAEIRLG